MKKVILTALAVLSLTACGKETVREVLVTTPPTEAPVVECRSCSVSFLV
jgi:hypothetical protein